MVKEKPVGSIGVGFLNLKDLLATRKLSQRELLTEKPFRSLGRIRRLHTVPDPSLHTDVQTTRFNGILCRFTPSLNTDFLSFTARFRLPNSIVYPQGETILF